MDVEDLAFSRRVISGCEQLTTAYHVAIGSPVIGTKTDKLSYVCSSVGRLTPFSASYQPSCLSPF
jgi:hypothetical protein